VQRKETRISLPDRLAFFRVLLVPVIIGLVLATKHTDAKHLFGIAALLVAIAAFTDYLDGAIARKRGITTVLGAFLDTTADKVLVSGVLIALVSVDRASVWVTFIIMMREFVVMAVRSVVAIDGGTVPASMAGKTKAVFQFMALGLAMLRLPETWGPWYLDQYWMWLAGFVTIASGWDYLVRFRKALIEVDQPAAT
jgi:CDP-diacylglycerol--glycerol-3-phosphate 3-phosphatidyltransferase